MSEPVSDFQTAILNGESDPSWYAGTAAEMRPLLSVIEQEIGRVYRRGADEPELRRLVEGAQSLLDASDLLDRIAGELDQ